MAKAIPQDVLDEGWRNSQFGGAFANDAAFATYLQSVLDEAGRFVASKLGATAYTAAASGTYLFDCLKRAELCFAGAVLWRRRATFADSQASSGLKDGAYLQQREYLAHAEKADACVQASLLRALKEAGVDATVLDEVPALAVGHIETGPFPATSTEALNV